MSGLKSRNKGKVGERELAKVLRSYGIEARRGRQYQGGDESPDVVAALPGFHIECKRYKKGFGIGTQLLDDAVSQAFDESHLAREPVVMWRVDHGKWMATLYRMVGTEPDATESHCKITCTLHDFLTALGYSKT